MFWLLGICFITSHPNPANHFVEYVKACEEKGVECKVIAGKNVADKFSGLKSDVVVFDLNDLDEDSIFSKVEKEIDQKSTVVTDIASEKWIGLNERIAEKYPSVKRVVYYDNPERYVPGGYSALAEKIIDKVQVVLFANMSFVEKGVCGEKNTDLDMKGKKGLGIGYYPMSDAVKISEKRKDEKQVSEIRSAFFKKNLIEDQGQKVFVYTGGANDVYYGQAFPHFIKIVSESVKEKDSPLKNTVLILQQHPRAKVEGNLDADLVESLKDLPEGFRFIVSDLPMTDVLSMADGVFYYQTSMAAQFVFAEIPAVIQIGHETYNDLLIRAGFPSVTTAKQLSEVLLGKNSKADVELLKKELGIDSRWKENLLKLDVKSVL